MGSSCEFCDIKYPQISFTGNLSSFPLIIAFCKPEPLLVSPLQQKSEPVHNSLTEFYNFIDVPLSHHLPYMWPSVPMI